MKKLMAILISLMLVAVFSLPVFADEALQAQSQMTTSAGVTANSQETNGLMIDQHYQVWAYDKDGNLKWYDEFHNLVPTVGLNYYLDCSLVSGCTSPALYVGIVTGPGSGTTYAAGDTMSSHAGWSEDTTYSEGTRQTWTPNGAAAAGSVSNSSSKAQFSINGSATIAGAFMSTDNTKSGSSGTLVGAGDFTGGDRSVVSGDTLNIQITASISSS